MDGRAPGPSKPNRRWRLFGHDFIRDGRGRGDAIGQVERGEELVKACPGLGGQVGEVDSPVGELPIRGPVLSSELVADQAKPFGALLGHILLNQAGSRSVAPGEEGRSQLRLYPANPEQSILLTRRGLLGAIHLEKDGEEWVEKSLS